MDSLPDNCSTLHLQGGRGRKHGAAPPLPPSQGSLSPLSKSHLLLFKALPHQSSYKPGKANPPLLQEMELMLQE